MLDTEQIKPKIEKLAKKYHLSLVALFGSQAVDKTHFQSDVDMAFLSSERMSLIDVSKMTMDFSKELEIGNLELVDMKNASPLLLKQVAQKSILLYEKEPSFFADFKIYAYKRFMEAKPLLDMREVSFNKFLQNI